MSHASHAKAQLWANRLRQFENSSLSVAQFCQSIGCSIPSFYQWRRKLSASIQPPAKPSPAASSFLQVQTKSDYTIQLKLPCGVDIIIPLEAIHCLPSILEKIA